MLRPADLVSRLLLLLSLYFASCDTRTRSVLPFRGITPRPAPNQYQPTWDSLDKRPLPSWYDEAKIGVFVHWGVYSVPSYGSEWFWKNWVGGSTAILNFMKNNYKPHFSYQDFAKDFTAEFYNATKWVDLFEKSGAKYVVLTSKHHDGYALWPSKYSYSWNSKDVGPHKDLIGELKQAVVKNKNLHFGLYHSLYEWFNPLYVSDMESNFTKHEFPDNKVIPEMYELVNKYEPEVFWSDGEWEAPSEYWKSKEFLAWLYNESPVKDKVVVNDRWGHETLCKHGGYWTCQDRYTPGVLPLHKWEDAMTIDKSTWGFSRVSPITNYLTTQELVDTLVRTVALGGNLLMNVGPAKDGTIPAIFQDRLLGVGSWLKVTGEAIYGSKPWDTCQNDTFTPDVWYTTNTKGNILYTFMLRWPESSVLYLSCPELSKDSTITMLGVKNKTLKFVSTDKKMTKIGLPDKALAKNDWAWVLKITDFKIL